MRVYDFPQGSDEWLQARIGIPTASQFSRIVTPAKLQLSKQCFDYMCEICAEVILGQPHDATSSQFMQRGSELEEEAITCHAWLSNCEIARVGFCTTDDGLVGCSPDGMIGDDGLIETKCPAAKTHIGYTLDPDRLVAAYRTQVQGQLWITERKWCDLVSWHPTLRPIGVRCERDEDAIAALSEAVLQFAENVADALEQLGHVGKERNAA